MDMYDWIMPSIKNRSLTSIPESGEYNFRIEKAKQQAKIDTVDRSKIVELVNEFLSGMGMRTTANPHITPRNTEKRRIDYSKINTQFKEDIVWIKFTTDNYVSVIGTSCDISFSNYSKEHTVAGIINQVLGKEWDETDILVFPLIGIPDNLYRSDIESGIGNYLAAHGVPILDYYSHNY